MIRHLILLLILCTSAFAGWRVHYMPEEGKDHYYIPARVTMAYYEDDSGHETLGDALLAIKAQGRIEKLNMISPHPFTESEDFQSEFIAALKEIAPEEWAAAERSAGNMHNPKISALRRYFTEAFMSTSLGTEISRNLAPYGMAITEFGQEKLRYEQVEGKRMIRGMFHVSIATANADDDNRFGITREIHGTSIFTFRDGKLLHELTKIGENWSEIFYNGVVPVFVRSGQFKENKPLVTSERFTGEAVVSVSQVSISGDDHPRRISVGSEIYNRSPSGFFELMPDPSETIKESRIMGLEYSTKELDDLRNRLLHGLQDK